MTTMVKSYAAQSATEDLKPFNIVFSSDDAQMTSVANKFDLIIDTVPYDHDLNPYVPTLALNGMLVLVGLLGSLGHALHYVGYLGH